MFYVNIHVEIFTNVIMLRKKIIVVQIPFAAGRLQSGVDLEGGCGGGAHPPNLILFRIVVQFCRRKFKSNHE